MEGGGWIFPFFVRQREVYKFVPQMSTYETGYSDNGISGCLSTYTKDNS